MKSVLFPEIKLLVENSHEGLQIGYFPKVKGLIIQKLGNISIQSESSLLINSRNLSSFVNQKAGEFLARKGLLNSTKLLPLITHNEA